MGINRVQTNRTDVIATVINSATGQTEFLYPQDQSIVFDKGSGQSSWDGPWYGTLYGEWTIIPTVDFKGQVKLWGAGGGSHGSTGGAGGGGGHTYGDVKFLKGIPYVVWVGEGGFYSHHNYDSNGHRYRYRMSSTFGQGGGGGHNAGGGGGLSGLFFDAAPTNGGPGAGFNAIGTTFRSPNQATALLIAGGGGGAGHHSTGSHGQGTGGGGDTANPGHAQAPANQHAGGHRWDAGAAGQNGWQFQGGFGGASSYTGGGGGGWYGGTGGSHSGGHHNGGGGGSGHIVTNTAAGYPNYWIREQYPNLVRNAATVTAPGAHQNHNPAAAGTSDIDYRNYVGYGGGNSTTFTPTLSSGNNGRVMIRFRGFGDT